MAHTKICLMKRRDRQLARLLRLRKGLTDATVSMNGGARAFGHNEVAKIKESESGAESESQIAAWSGSDYATDVAPAFRDNSEHVSLDDPALLDALHSFARTNANSAVHPYSRYAISFHGHRGTVSKDKESESDGEGESSSSDQDEQAQGEQKDKRDKRTRTSSHWQFKKEKNFSLRQVHLIVRGGVRCPARHCGGYSPRVWQG